MQKIDDGFWSHETWVVYGPLRNILTFPFISIKYQWWMFYEIQRNYFISQLHFRWREIFLFPFDSRSFLVTLWTCSDGPPSRTGRLPPAQAALLLVLLLLPSHLHHWARQSCLLNRCSYKTMFCFVIQGFVWL